MLVATDRAAADHRLQSLVGSLHEHSGYSDGWPGSRPRDRTKEAIQEAIREGRTTVSRVPPGQGGGPFFLEADADGNGAFEAIAGDRVPPGSAMRVRATGLPATGLVKVRANGATLVDEVPLGPDGELRFRAPEQRGWVRADLQLAPGESQGAPGCEPNGGAITTCAYDYLMAAITSPIYLGR
jgi:hypothetical protein